MAGCIGESSALEQGLAIELAALLQVLVIDVALAGDNAIIVGLAVAGMPERQQNRAIMFGIGAAAVLRIVFAIGAVWLLSLPGLQLFGGLLLLWVCWRMFRDLRAPKHGAGGVPVRKTMLQAIVQITLADVSMSLDNVLAVAGAAAGHLRVLVIGLVISVVLMAVAARLIARLLERYGWIAWIGLAVVLFVAVRMVWEGLHQVRPYLDAAIA